MTNPEEVKEEKKSLNFIEAKVEEDLANGKNGGRVHNGFMYLPAVDVDRFDTNAHELYVTDL